MPTILPIKRKISHKYYSYAKTDELQDCFREAEQDRKNNLMWLVSLASSKCDSVLDIGARDGSIASLLTNHFKLVIALDLEKPKIEHNAIKCVQGNLVNLQYANNTFDMVFCSEVLEHIPRKLLPKACTELERVAKRFLVIGVPFMQDTRVGRTTCLSCNKKNPPWGHVTSFNQEYLIKIFPSFQAKEISFVGKTKERTNFLSTYLMDLAGNPYGTYSQIEHCVYCGLKLKTPPERTISQKIITKIAIQLNTMQKPFIESRPNWIQILFEKKKQ